MDDYPLVYVRWLDSRAVGRGWVLTENVKSDVMNCHSVGWLYKDLESSVMIIPHFAENPEQCNGGLEIPKCSILDIVKLKVVADEVSKEKKRAKRK